MKCRTTNNHLQDYLDHTLPAALKEELECHFAMCPACREKLNQWKWLGEAARRMPLVDPQPGLEIILRRRLRQVDVSLGSRGWFRIPKYAYQAVAVGLLGMAIGALLFPFFWPAGPREEVASQPAVHQEDKNSAQLSRPPLPPLGSERPDASMEGTSVANHPPSALYYSPRIGAPLPGTIISNPEREFVEYLLKGTGQDEITVRMPKTIYIRPSMETDQAYFRYISH